MAGINQVSFTSPYAADESAIAYRRKLADMLAKEAIDPIPTNRMAGRFVVPISPWEGAAKIAKGLGSAYAQNQSEEKHRELVKQMGGDAMKWATSQPQGTPAQIQDTSQEGTGSMDMSGMAGPANTPAQPPDQQAVMSHLMQGLQNPRTAPIAQMQLAQLMKSQEDYTLNEGAQRRGPGGVVRAENPKDFRPEKPPVVKQSDLAQAMAEKAQLPPGDPRHAAYDNLIRKLSETAKQISPTVNNFQPPPITAVSVIDDDPKSPTFGKAILKDGRSGKVLGIDSRLDQGAQGGKAGAVATAQAESKRTFNMGGLGATIQEAEDLLTGKSGKDLPTGSGVGTAWDFAAGLVGVNPQGAKEAETLKSIGGALVSKMPRMEGPQSDKDVMLYKEMAARVGDSTVPRERRVAALEKVKELWSKYEKPAGGQPAPQTATGPNGEKLQLVGGKWVPM